jgi:hypothetical protein
MACRRYSLGGKPGSEKMILYHTYFTILGAIAEQQFHWDDPARSDGSTSTPLVHDLAKNFNFQAIELNKCV